ncbi:sensor histidine kinase [Ciceribacter sp. L1K22]|uniref:sensor histidine kinase n=1 Tax=Ciceribacter sp. L1K22 TaxID=2820275 RepID=UPI0032B21942
MQRLKWHKQGLADDTLLEFFISTLVEMKASLILQDTDLNYLCVTGLPEYWTLMPDDTPSDISVFGEEHGVKLEDLKRSLLTTGEQAELELTMAPDMVFQFRIHTFKTADRIYIATVVLDRSEDLRREKLLRALLREVSHRSKNLLAIIQSIAAQTARYSDSLSGFLEKFRGRLHSLSQSQDLITDSSWRGAYFVDLLRHQTDKYLADQTDIIELSGDDTLLSPNASLHLGLALHELIVNAVIHGDIVGSGKRIKVASHKIDRNGVPHLRITWHEPRSIGPEMDPDGKRAMSFGSTVLERVVPASVNGTATYSIGKSAVSYELVFPLDEAAE